MASRKFIVSIFVMASAGACRGNEQTTEFQKSAEELRALTQQVNALREAKNPYEGMALDVRDGLQKNFVDSRLRFVGKNPENSPNLFARLERNSDREVATGVAALGGDSEVDIDADCDSPLSVTQDPLNLTHWEARVITSCFSGADYSYVDLFWWNSATGAVLAYDYNEDFTDPRDLVLEIDAEAGQVGTTIHVDSMTINSRGLTDHYFFDGVIQDRPGQLAARDTIFHPRDLNANGTVLTCLDRGALNDDCDYYFAGSSGNIMLPIGMEFRFPGTVSSIVSAMAQVHMKDDGGVCKTADLAPYLTTAGAVVTINTSALPNGAISFGNRCVANQTNVRFWVKIIALNSRGAVYSMFWANDRPDDPLHFNLRFVWSCLAEGSVITMADGTTKAIENIHMGDAVRSEVPGRSLQVVNITKGLESARMVEVEDARGHVVLATEGHPFFDDTGLAVRAESLQVGDRVQTDEGFTAITRIDRKFYGGQVYNLKLGTDEEAAAGDVSKTHMFANGYRVGDSRSQTELELRRRALAVIDAPKAEWTADYLARKVRDEL